MIRIIIVGGFLLMGCQPTTTQQLHYGQVIKTGIECQSCSNKGTFYTPKILPEICPCGFRYKDSQ